MRFFLTPYPIFLSDYQKETYSMNLLRRTTVFLMILMIAVACRQQTLSAENVELDISVTDSLVGETTLIVTVTDADGNIIENPGTLSLRGDMDHAGMLPVIVESSDSDNGVFTVPFEWTMSGAWLVEVTLTLENGDVATQTFDFEILTEAGDDMGDMEMATEEADHDMHDMEMSTEEADHDMDMGGETSAVYMTITNNGDETIAIVGAEADIAGIVELHETVVENDIASMQPVETLVIEAGETLELSPGRIHLMLMELKQDIVADETVELSLILESGDTVTVTALVQDMVMEELEAITEVDDLVFSNVWARPASAGTMDMSTEEADSD